MEEKQDVEENMNIQITTRVKRNIKVYGTILVVTFLLEILLFNLSAIRSMGNQPTDITSLFALGEGISYCEEHGKYVIEAEEVSIHASQIGAEVRNMYLNLMFEENIVEYQISLTDDGNSKQYNMAGQTLLNYYEGSKYITIHPYGNVRSMSILFRATPGTEFSMGNIMINAKQPINIRWIRVGCLFALLSLLALMRKDSSIHTRVFDARDTKQLLLGIGICVVCLGLTWLVWKSNVDYWRTDNVNGNYYNITHALSEGHFDINPSPSEKLMSLENPYDYYAREANDVMEAWDTAYYNSKFYCYFGIVPVLLTYLPGYIVTGTMPENVTVALTFSLFMVTGCFFLVYQMIKRWCKQVPFFLWPVLSVIMCFAENFFYLYMRPDFYNIPILTANALTVWGLGLWLRGLNGETKKWIWYMLGSLCMSLVAGSRPQMVLISVLAIPLFWQEVIVQRELFSKKGLRDTVAICMPYIIVAAGLMYYNYARFGSPFEFGAIYNLTTNDMTRRGFNLDRLGGGIFTLLFQPPIYLATFPYLQGAVISSRYMGKMIVEFVYGGIFATNMITWLNVSIFHIKDILKKYKVWFVVIVSLILALVLGCIDATIAGILQRYTADIAFMVVLPACIIAMVLMDYLTEHKSRAYYLLTSAIIMSLLMVILFDFCMMFIHTGSGNIHGNNDELYYLVDSYFRI